MNNKRAAIYARFSSDRQNEKSCRDQINLASMWAQHNGFDVVDSYQDAAISGASTRNRPALAELMRNAQLGKFDTVICEGLDRLSRDQADLAQIRKDLVFYNVTIHTVQDGEVGTIHIGIKGLMGELYLADLAQKTKRGLQAVVNDGRQAGGKSYGYDSIGGGELVINENQAVVIERIFNEYSHNKTPREIARDLNADDIPSPRGGKWNASTINGNRQRQNGILQNQLYIGKTVWNRQRFIKDPSTGKRVSRANPPEEWVYHDAPDLRIIEDELWQAVTNLKTSKSQSQYRRARKPKHVFSGMIKCGCCGASYTIFTTDRLICSGNRERGDCDNKRTITRQHIEKRVLSALHAHLAEPELIAEYVKAYHDERRRLQKSERGNAQQKQRQINSLTVEIDRGVDLLLKGVPPDSLMQKIKQMEVEKKQLEEELAQQQQRIEPVIIHPAAAEKYKNIVASLQSHMENIEEGLSRDDIFREVRKIVDKIVITPTPGNVGIEVHGQLAALLKIQDDPICMGSMVAGAGFEPTTFGL
ncbi:recombinase family protein [Methylophaga sp. UBA3991]|uniref:recombinase family protein n=4 Tax=unclassified Methylophaga TaxID=2629249 RepID=UPI00259CC4C3|nr:recombinase family protein [Methylophaga sp. UBA3991]